MGKQIHRAAKFYSSMILDNIGLFIFIGFFAVIFQEQGFFPNKEIYAISGEVYRWIIPICISFSGGEKISGRPGGILAVLMTAGMLHAGILSVMLAAMLAAPLGGLLWKYSERFIKKYAGVSLQMLVKNLLVGFLGGILAVFGYYIAAPFLEMLGNGIAELVAVLLRTQLSGLLCLFIEPLKILFLNNVLNHGLLVPLGMRQAAETGSSILFLLETNPGPGFGLLAAIYISRREKRETCAAAMAAELIGGIHEVYFPEVVSNLRLLVPLMLSSAAGVFWFSVSGAGLAAPASPGSILTLLLLSGSGMYWKTAVGILLSAAVSFVGCLLLLKRQSGHVQEAVPQQEGMVMQEAVTVTKPDIKAEVPGEIHCVGFICDAGVGSSAMGAALFRRKLKQEGIEDVGAEAYASDNIPETLDLIVCQKDFRERLPESALKTEIFLMESLLDKDDLETLIQRIKAGNGK